MAEAEERVRARYRDELDTINDHWGEVEAVTGPRLFQVQQAALEMAQRRRTPERTMPFGTNSKN